MGNKMKIGILSLFIVGATLGVYSSAQARVRRNEVRSVHIKDGEVKNRDLDTNSVTTDKIADGQVQNADIAGNAVTPGKIAPGAAANADLGADAVTTDKIADSAVTTEDIADSTVNGGNIATGAVTTSNIENNAVTGAKIADGVITDADINNVANIDPSKFEPGTFSKLYDQVLNVSTDGNGDFTDPVAAMASITDNSAANQYLLKIMPGVYDIGANSVQMKQYVDIEGCGENVTRIVGNVDNENSGVVRGANNAELRLLTVENTGGGTYSKAIYNGGVSPKITHVTAIATGGTMRNEAIYNTGASCAPTLNYVTASAVQGGGAWPAVGIHNYYSGAVVINNVIASTSGSGANYAIWSRGCYAPVIIKNTTATAAGNCFAVYSYDCSYVLENSVASVSGGGIAVYNVTNTNSYPVMRNVTATTTGGQYAYAIYNGRTSTSMTNVTATATGGTYANYGMRNHVSGTVTVDRCVISGATSAIWSDGATTNVSHSKLDGGNVINSNGGTTNCAANYDENYAFSTNICP